MESEISALRGAVGGATDVAKPTRTLGTLGLIVVGFFWTSGGFYGSELVMGRLHTRALRPRPKFCRRGSRANVPLPPPPPPLFIGAGPSVVVLGVCLLAPLFYSLPTALISAELATNYPETGGQCVYVTLACGSMLGAHNTWW